jgi:hypothetical protein
MPLMLTLPNPYPPVGSKWRDADRRAKRTVQVVRLDLGTRRVRIHCIETDILSWAKPERFNGTSRGYIPLGADPARKAR